MSEMDKSAPESRYVSVATNLALGNIEGTTGLSSGDSLRDSHGGPLVHSGDDGRTHRNWIAKPGRIKKCDFCESRSAGIIHQCSKCPVLICRDCAMNGQWKGDMTHYVDARELNWEYPAIKKTNTYFTGSQPARRSRSNSVAPDAGASAAGSDNSNKPNGSGPKRRVRFTDDENSRNSRESVAQKRQRKAQSPISSASSTHGQTRASLAKGPELQAAHEDNNSFGKSPELPLPSDENHVYTISSSSATFQQSPSPKELISHGGSLTAAAGRSAVRASAAMAMHRMSTPGRRFQENMRDLEEKKDKNIVESKSQIPGDPSRAQHPRRVQSGSGPQPLLLEATNKRLKAEPNLPLQRQAPYNGPFPSRKREQQVMGLYYVMFGVQGYHPLYLTITDLPRNAEQDVMVGLAHHEPPLPGLPVRNRLFPQLKAEPASPPEHAVYHKQVREYMMTGGYFDPTRTLPPQPPNYAEDSFNNYPEGLAYVPTLRTTPIWSPMNELSPEELRIMHDDRDLKDKINAAWQTNPVVLRVREFGLQAFNLSNWVGKGAGPGDYEALKLLWEVALVRMGRVVLPSAPQTRKWFVDELKNVFFEENPDATMGEDEEKIVVMRQVKKEVVDLNTDGNGLVNVNNAAREDDKDKTEEEETEVESGDCDDNQDSDYNP